MKRKKYKDAVDKQDFLKHFMCVLAQECYSCLFKVSESVLEVKVTRVYIAEDGR